MDNQTVYSVDFLSVCIHLKSISRIPALLTLEGILGKVKKLVNEKIYSLVSKFFLVVWDGIWSEIIFTSTSTELSILLSFWDTYGTMISTSSF